MINLVALLLRFLADGRQFQLPVPFALAKLLQLLGQSFLLLHTRGQIPGFFIDLAPEGCLRLLCLPRLLCQPVFQVLARGFVVLCFFLEFRPGDLHLLAQLAELSRLCTVPGIQLRPLHLELIPLHRGGFHFILKFLDMQGTGLEFLRLHGRLFFCGKQLVPYLLNLPGRLF